MKLSEVRVTYKLLEKALELPLNVRIVSILVIENDQFVIKLASPSKTKLPKYFMVDSLAKIGQVYSNPNKKEYQYDRKGTTTYLEPRTKEKSKRSNNNTSRKTPKSKSTHNKKTMR